jgi:hypothetical protein
MQWRGAGGEALLIPHRVPLARQNVSFHIHPEGYKKINDNGRTHGKKGEIDKIEPDFGRSDVKLVAQVFAYAKCIVLNKTSKFVHRLRKISCKLR